MAGNYSNQDSFDIQELAKLNDDFSTDFIEKLQNQVAQNASGFVEQSNDGALFEEVQPKPDTPIETEVKKEPEAEVKEVEKAPKVNIDDSFDDNFIKKYKAKLNKQKTRAAIEPSPAAEKTDFQYLLVFQFL